MDSGGNSKAGNNLEFQLFDFNEVEFMDNRNNLVSARSYQQNETIPTGINVEVGSPPAFDQQNNNQLLEVPHSGNNNNDGPNQLTLSETSLVHPTHIEASQIQKTTEDLQVEIRADEQPQVNANPHKFPLHKQVDLVSSPDSSTDESFLPKASSNPYLVTYTGFENSDPTLVGGRDAQQTSSPFSPLIMEATQSFPLALAEKIPQNESYVAQPFYSEHEVNPLQANQLNETQNGNTLQVEVIRTQPVRAVDRGKAKMYADNQFEKTINGNRNFNDYQNQQRLPYPNLFPQSPSGFGFLNGGSSQINHQTPNWLFNKENDLSRPLAPSGSQVNQFKASSSSDPQCYNFFLPSSEPLWPQQVQKEPATYNSQICSTIFSESSMPLRTPILPPQRQINPLGVSDLQYRDSVQSKSSLLPSGGLFFQDLSDQRHSQLNSNSILQEPFMHSFSGSGQLPANQQLSNQFSMMPGLLNSDQHNSELPESSIFPRQQQGLLSQTARPIPTYPTPGSSLSKLVLNSLLQPETGGNTSAPLQLGTSLSSPKELGIFEPRGQTRSRFEVGESSSFKRFKRDSTMPQTSSAGQENKSFLSLQNEGSSNSNTNYMITTTPSQPRAIRNSLYDPLYEGIGLPVDPHLRLFAMM